ncbi:MAG TPA: hypothetical protein VLJ15_02275 [Gammaproteobacteria bacterium]|nr:hypothetical protein [Gammaproteobacteria bacterium]
MHRAFFFLLIAVICLVGLMDMVRQGVYRVEIKKNIQQIKREIQKNKLKFSHHPSSQQMTCIVDRSKRQHVFWVSSASSGWLLQPVRFAGFLKYEDHFSAIFRDSSGEAREVVMHDQIGDEKASVVKIDERGVWLALNGKHFFVQY